MTLREYFIKINRRNIDSIFNTYCQAAFAEGWDAEAFSKRFLNKDLDEATYEEMKTVFKAIVKTFDPFYYEDIDEDYVTDDCKIIIGDGNYKKVSQSDGYTKKLERKFNPCLVDPYDDED